MSKIEWCDVTWNPITGCTPISEGCQNCYAQRMANRLQGRFGYPAKPNQFDVTLHASQLGTPYGWTKKPRRIFVCSMGDLYHPDVKEAWRGIVYDRIRLVYPYHTFMLLTKRPENIQQSFEAYKNKTIDSAWPKNQRLWLGVTAENQKRADERIPVLLQIPVAVRFVSVEPMLGPVDLLGQEHIGRIHSKHEVERLDWVIAGPETGPGARECKPEWIEDLYEQCKAAGVSFFDKRKDYLAREFPNIKDVRP